MEYELSPDSAGCDVSLGSINRSTVSGTKEGTVFQSCEQITELYWTAGWRSGYPTLRGTGTESS